MIGAQYRKEPLWIFPVCSALLFLSACQACEETSNGENPDTAAATQEPPHKLRKSTSILEFHYPREVKLAEQLGALGYVDWAPLSDGASGVVVHQQEAGKGLNLFNSRPRNAAVLVDMDGCLVHQWDMSKDSEPASGGFHHVELLSDGSLLAIRKDQYIVKIDRENNIVWKRTHGAHHDLDVHTDGRIFALTREERDVTHEDKQLSVLGDEVSILDHEGKTRRAIELYDIFHDRIANQQWKRIENWLKNPRFNHLFDSPLDVFHTNSIQWVEWGEAGDEAVLLSVRELNRLFVVRLADQEVLWEWGEGELEEQHHATLLDDGTVLVFDNGVHRRQSRALRVDPESNEIVQEITDDEFFAHRGSGVQLLDNDHFLLTNYGEGRVKQIAPDGEVVWEYRNPDTSKRGRGAIYRMKRFSADDLTGLREIIDAHFTKRASGEACRQPYTKEE